MRIIDEKGRLFGKINVIDFLVVSTFVFIVPISYFAYKLFNKPLPKVQEPAGQYRQYIILGINFKFNEVPPEISQLIMLGDKEINESGETIGEIIWLGQGRPYEYKFDLGKGEIISQLTQELKEIPARLKIKAQIKNDNLFYKDRQIMSNSKIEFKTLKYTLSAIPVREEKKREEKKIDLNVILKNLSEEELALISVGDKEIDKNEDIIAEILKIGKKENSIYEINLGSGNIVAGEDSSKKQVFTKMRLKCEFDREGKPYFKGQEIRYDSLLEFKTGKYTAKGRLASLMINEKWIEVKVKFSGLILELAKAISEGDSENDYLGRPAGRLKAIIGNKPSEANVLALEQNKFVTIPQPFQRDIEVILSLLCAEKEGIFYFKNYPVKMGNMVTFTTDLYSISGLIVGL